MRGPTVRSLTRAPERNSTAIPVLIVRTPASRRIAITRFPPSSVRYSRWFRRRKRTADASVAPTGTHLSTTSRTFTMLMSFVRAQLSTSSTMQNTTQILDGPLVAVNFRSGSGAEIRPAPETGPWPRTESGPDSGPSELQQGVVSRPQLTTAESKMMAANPNIVRRAIHA